MSNNTQEALALYESGDSMRKIARTLGISYTRVNTIISKAGVKKRTAGQQLARYDEDDKSEVIKLHKSGLGYTKIGALLDMPRSTVRNIVTKFLKSEE